MKNPALPPRDPGLQGERTSLAWMRTALAALVNALLVLRTGIVDELPAMVLAGTALIVLAGVIALFGHLRGREILRAPVDRAAAGRVAAVAIVSTCTVAASVSVIAMT